jgi:Tfp pilus assembly protein PilF
MILVASIPLVSGLSLGCASFLCAPALSLGETTESSSLTLLNIAYSQMRERNFEGATKTLCDSIRTDGDSIAARRYLCYSLLQRGYPHEALTQIKVIGEPLAFDLYLRGVASEMIGEPTQAADFFRQAVDKEPTNDFFRMKAIKSLITVSKYQDAVNLCANGKSTDSKSRKFYEEEMRRAEFLERTISKDRPCSFPKH